LLTGEERLTVQGVNVAIQRETLRQRQIEFLTATNNPTDMKIMGVKGRSAVLRSVSTTIGMPGEEIVPSEDQIDKMMAGREAASAERWQHRRADPAGSQQGRRGWRQAHLDRAHVRCARVPRAHAGR
jgi:hypothetical protein